MQHHPTSLPHPHNQSFLPLTSYGAVSVAGPLTAGQHTGAVPQATEPTTANVLAFFTLFYFLIKKKKKIIKADKIYPIRTTTTTLHGFINSHC